MTSRQELLIEANNRGLLVGSKKQAFDEAVNRGIISLPESTDVQPEVPQDQDGIAAALKTSAAVPLEFAAGVNSAAASLIDFLGPDQVNAVLQLSGSEKRVPTLRQAAQPATSGGFLDEGLARDIVRAAGQVSFSAVAPQQALRGGAQQLPKIASGSESVAAGALRQAGEQTAIQAARAGAAVGAGAEIGGEVGEAVAGEEGRQIGELTGGILLPVAPAIAAQSVKQLVTPSAKKFLKAAAPTVEGLKSAAREVYKEIDDLGVVILPSRTTRLSNQLGAVARKEGFNSRIQPKVAAVLDEFQKVKGVEQTTTEIDTLRKVAQSAASSTEPEERRLGSLIINKIDDFFDGLSINDVKKWRGIGVGEKFKDARQLWRRAKKAEQLDDAFEVARNQASGFENGIRTQFRTILNSKKKSRGFTQEELSAMKKVVRGGPIENTVKALGKFGFSEGQASGMLLGSLGVAGGAAVGGSAGAVAVPLIGQISKNLAQKLTRKNAEFANAVVRAGKSGPEVARAYLRNVPAKDRNPEELAQLLLRPEISLVGLERKAATLGKSSKKLVNDAAFLVNFVRSQKIPQESNNE